MGQNPTYKELEQRIRELEKEQKDHKKMYLSSQHPDSFYQIILENISDAVIITNDQGDMVYVCPNTENIFGLSDTEVLKFQLIQKLIGGDIFSLSELKKQGEIQNIEWSIKDSSEQKRFLLINVKSVNIKNGTILYVMRDIIDRKQVEMSLTESEEKFRLLHESCAIGMGYWTTEGKVISFNKIATELMGGKPEDFIGKSTTELFGEEKGNVYLDRILKCVETKKQQSYEDTVILPGGKRTFHSTYNVVENNEAIILGIQITSMDITERKQAEQETEKAFAMISRAEKVAKMGSWTWIPKTNEVRWSANMCRLFGINPSEFDPTFDYANQYTHPDDMEYVNKYVEYLLKEKKSPPTSEYRIITSKQEIKWVSGTSEVVLDDKGEIEEIVGTIQDITDRKLAEDALKASESRFREMAQYINDVFWLFDWKNKKVIYASPAYESIWGRSIKSLLANYSEWSDSLHPDDQAYAKATFQSLIETGHSEIREYRILRPDGSVRWVADSGFLIKDKSGEILRITGVARDITDFKMAQEALSRSMNMMSSFLNNVPTTAFLKDRQGKYLFVNRNYAQRVHRSPKEVIGLTDYDIVAEPETAAFFQSNDEIVLQKQEIMSEESTFNVESGEYSLITLKFPVFDEQGNVCAVGGVSFDITARKQMEKQQRRVQKMEAVGTLAGGIAHEFNNLLAIILGNVELLTDTTRYEDMDFVDSIYNASIRGRTLVRQLLTFTRKSDDKFEPLNLKVEIRNITKMLNRIMPRSISIQTDIADDLLLTNANSGQIEQILTNLAINAKDAMPDGGSLSFIAKNASEADLPDFQNVKKGRYVQLMITDTGHGMDQETLEQIFDPFFSTKPIGEGTGLGLSVVFGIIESYSGYIYCESSPGKGATFKIFLPEADTPESSEAAKKTQIQQRGTLETILTVDDEDDILSLLQIFLSRMGYKTVAASSGEEALKIYKTHQNNIDLIMLDLGMPGMGGHKCLKELIQFDPNVKVIIASGYSEEGLIKDTLLNGAADYIVKPFERDEVAKVIRKVLDM